MEKERVATAAEPAVLEEDICYCRCTALKEGDKLGMGGRIQFPVNVCRAKWLGAALGRASMQTLEEDPQQQEARVPAQRPLGARRA